MPCYSPSFDKEEESAKVSRLLIYVYENLNIKVPTNIIENASFDYKDISNEVTSLLCSTIRGMSDSQKESIIYNAHSKKSRKLADWWDEHYAFDVREGRI